MASIPVLLGHGENTHSCFISSSNHVVLISFAAWSLSLRWNLSPLAVSCCTIAEAWQQAAMQSRAGSTACLRAPDADQKKWLNAVRVRWPTQKTDYSSLCTSLMRAVD